MQSETYELIDSIYYVPIMSNSLENSFSVVAHADVTTSYSTDWKTVGEYSLKAVLTSQKYFGIYKGGSTSSDPLDDITNVRVTVNTDAPVRLLVVSRKSSDNTEYNDYLDITESGTYTIPVTVEEDIKRIDFRVNNRQSTTATVYFDNVIFY